MCCGMCLQKNEQASPFSKHFETAEKISLEIFLSWLHKVFETAVMLVYAPFLGGTG